MATLDQGPTTTATSVEPPGVPQPTVVAAQPSPQSEALEQAQPSEKSQPAVQEQGATQTQVPIQALELTHGGPQIQPPAPQAAVHSQAPLQGQAPLQTKMPMLEPSSVQPPANLSHPNMHQNPAQPPPQHPPQRSIIPSMMNSTAPRSENIYSGGPRHGPGGRGGDSRPNKPTVSRLFVGNLLSEVVTKRDFRTIWEKYGTVLEVAIHRSFGFVQFENPESLDAAIKGEQGRLIGGKPIDLQRAKSDARRPSHPPDRMHGSRMDDRRGRDHGRGHGRDHYGRDRDDGRRGSRRNGRRSRSRSPRRDRRSGRDDRGRRGEGRDRHGRGHRDRSREEVLPPINGAVVSVVLLGEQQRPFAESACAAIRQVGIPYEISMLDGRSLGKALRDAETNRSRYALIVGRDNARKQQITTKMLHLRNDGRCPTFEYSIPELVDRLVSAERELGFLEAGAIQQGPQGGARLGMPPPFNPSSGNNQNSVASLASLLQTVQSAQGQPQHHQQQQQPVNPSLVAQQLQQLQQLQLQLQQQITPAQQQLYQQPPVQQQQRPGQGAPNNQYYQPQQPQGYPSMAPPPQQQPQQGDQRKGPGQISELSRLLNTLQQRSTGR